MQDRERNDAADLVPRLEVIESQPIAARAAAYDALHDELARTLESGPTATSPRE